LLLHSLVEVDGHVTLLLIGPEIFAAEDAGANHEQGSHGFAEAVGGERVGGGEVLVQRLGVLHLEARDREGSEILSKCAVEKLGLLFGVAGDVEIAALFRRGRRKRFFGDGAFERAVGLELELGGAANGVEVRREDRKLDELAVGSFYQDAVAALKIVLELAEGSLLPCGGRR